MKGVLTERLGDLSRIQRQLKLRPCEFLSLTFELLSADARSQFKFTVSALADVGSETVLHTAGHKLVYIFTTKPRQQGSGIFVQTKLSFWDFFTIFTQHKSTSLTTACYFGT